MSTDNDNLEERTVTPARTRLTAAVERRPVRAVPAAALDLLARLTRRASGAATTTAERLLDVPAGLIAEAHAEQARAKRDAGRRVYYPAGGAA